MKLGQILEGLAPVDLRGDPALEIQGLAYDSRQVKPGDLFVAVRGHRSDGHRFIDRAVEKGAVAVAVETLTGREGNAAIVLVPDSRKALSRLALAFYANPFKDITLIGITGTSGKTTTTYLLESMVKAAGQGFDATLKVLSFALRFLPVVLILALGVWLWSSGLLSKLGRERT